MWQPFVDNFPPRTDACSFHNIKLLWIRIIGSSMWVLLDYFLLALFVARINSWICSILLWNRDKNGSSTEATYRWWKFVAIHYQSQRREMDTRGNGNFGVAMYRLRTKWNFVERNKQSNDHEEGQPMDHRAKDVQFGMYARFYCCSDNVVMCFFFLYFFPFNRRCIHHVTKLH